MTKTKIMPIFPLDLVLFPRQELPLRIFEPRYKQLVDDCMLGDGQFGVCLIDSSNLIGGWNGPKSIGTIVKITKCEDIEIDGMQLNIQTMGRSKFKIKKIIPPSIELPENYDPYSIEGHQAISDINEKSHNDEKMYIRAEVELIPEIDDNISLNQWEHLVDLWKKKTVKQALPQVIEPAALDQILTQYYLKTDTPTIDYVYSLAALGAQDPIDLQPILEANLMEELIQKIEELMTIK
ncbi:MAG TPA: LON peptidase substrate-binding domain-containing protein [Nitrosopumilaceae archaeon]|nr:LON peptidase substrate-binding domain-containing protein [Nitrosopumilaceae archaeon]